MTLWDIFLHTKFYQNEYSQTIDREKTVRQIGSSRPHRTYFVHSTSVKVHKFTADWWKQL